MNPLEILENQLLAEDDVKNKEDDRDSRLDEFVSDDESVESDEKYYKRVKKRDSKMSKQVKTDKFGRRIRYQQNKTHYVTDDLKTKMKRTKKYEMYKQRKNEYQKEKNPGDEGESQDVSKYQLSAIDRMTLRREQLLKKHSENFIKDVRKSKVN